MKLTKSQADAITRLLNQREFSVFLQMLAKYAETKNQALIMQDDINTDVARGELRALAVIQRAVHEAPEQSRQYDNMTEEYAHGTP